MDSEETKVILSMIEAEFWQFFQKMPKEIRSRKVLDWAVAFKDDDFKTVQLATIATLSVQKDFPPNIAHIKEKISEMKMQKQVSEMEAWNVVRKALSDGCYYSADERFLNLPINIQKCVGSPETLKTWCMMDLDQLNTVISSNFMRSYKQVCAREKENLSLPKAFIELQIQGEESKNIESVKQLTEKFLCE